jgi:hypothetical protein
LSTTNTNAFFVVLLCCCRQKLTLPPRPPPPSDAYTPLKVQQAAGIVAATTIKEYHPISTFSKFLAAAQFILSVVFLLTTVACIYPPFLLLSSFIFCS